MISRGFVRIEGPPESGKTTLIERILNGNRSMFLCAARFDEDPAGKRSGEIREGDPHVDRFHAAGAAEAAALRFAPESGESLEDFFWTSDLMMGYFHGLLLENPGSLDLYWAHTVFVVQPLDDGEELFERGPLRVPRQFLESALGSAFPGIGMGNEFAERAIRSAAAQLEREGIGNGDHWRLRDPYARMAGADTVMINVPSDPAPGSVERTKEQITRMVREADMARDIFLRDAGFPRLHVETGDLRARSQPEINRAINRIRAALRRASDYEPER